MVSVTSLPVPAYPALLFVTALVSGALLLLTLPQWDRKGALPVMGILCAIQVWSTADGMALVLSAPAEALFWENVRFVGSSLLPVAVFVFALQYTGRAGLVTRRRALALLAVPVLTNVLVWTNPSHELIRTAAVVTERGASAAGLDYEWGPWFYAHVVYSYLLVVTALVLFVERALRYGQSRRVVRRSQLLVLLTLLPAVGNLAYVFGLTRVDYTPVWFAAGGLVLFAVGLSSRPVLPSPGDPDAP